VASSLDGYLHAFFSNGAYLCGFPAYLGSPSLTEMAAADIDGDGMMEIITGTTNGMLHSTGYNGAAKSGFPVQCGASITGSPTVLDNNKIAVGTSSNLLLISPDGTILFTKPIPASMASGPVLGDLNRDGDLDIVFVTLSGALYAVDQTGADLPGFPLSVGVNFNAPPLIANLDSDLNPEILLSSYINSVFAYNHDGSMLPGYPFVTSYNGCTPGTICDFDANGMLKLVSGYSTGVLMVNLRTPETPVMPWVTYRGSLKRQGSFASTGYVASDDPVQPELSDQLQQNYPNPFNPSTTIAFQTKNEGGVKLAVYNLKGQLVRVLQDGIAAKGKHNVVWDGLDSNGSRVSSGLYLYRLQTGDASITKRMLLVK
jgi:hypothetical protein